jgi:symplekin
MPEVFTQEVLATVLSKLSDQTKLPTLFMRSVLDCLRLFPTLSKFINGLLARLVGKQVWRRPKLWEGFSIAITKNFPSSLSVILQLPKTHAIDLLKRRQDLTEMLIDYLEKIPSHQQGRREVIQLGNLVEMSRD